MGSHMFPLSTVEPTERGRRSSVGVPATKTKLAKRGSGGQISAKNKFSEIALILFFLAFFGAILKNFAIFCEISKRHTLAL